MESCYLTATPWVSLNIHLIYFKINGNTSTVSDYRHGLMRAFYLDFYLDKDNN